MMVECERCAAWPGACPAHSTFWSDGAGRTHGGAVLCVDVAHAPPVAKLAERAARGAGLQTKRIAVEPEDPRSAAGQTSQAAAESRASLIILPHTPAGCAIAALVAAQLGAALVAGCDELTLDESGGVKAIRSRYGGLVVAAGRCAPGAIVATVHARAVAGTVPAMPASMARRLLVIGDGLAESAKAAARTCATAVGALAIEARALGVKALSPDLCVTAGVEGGTEINSLLRGSRILVTLVADPAAPIAQIADYVLAGNLEEHMAALTTAAG